MSQRVFKSSCPDNLCDYCLRQKVLKDIIKDNRIIMADTECMFTRQLRINKSETDDEIQYSCGAYVEPNTTAKKLRVGTANGLLNIRVDTLTHVISYLKGNTNKVVGTGQQIRRRERRTPRIEIYEREGIGYDESIL